MKVNTQDGLISKATGALKPEDYAIYVESCWLINNNHCVALCHIRFMMVSIVLITGICIVKQKFPCNSYK